MSGYLAFPRCFLLFVEDANGKSTSNAEVTIGVPLRTFNF